MLLASEPRDAEQARLLLEAAETGHLVLTTLRGFDTASAVLRLLSLFPADERAEVRARLARVLRWSFTQQLVPHRDGRRPVVEVWRSDAGDGGAPGRGAARLGGAGGPAARRRERRPDRVRPRAGAPRAGGRRGARHGGGERGAAAAARAAPPGPAGGAGVKRAVVVARPALQTEATLGALAAAGFEAVAVAGAAEVRAHVEVGAAAWCLGRRRRRAWRRRRRRRSPRCRPRCGARASSSWSARASPPATGLRAFQLGVDLVVATADTARLGELVGAAVAAKRSAGGAARPGGGRPIWRLAAGRGGAGTTEFARARRHCWGEVRRAAG